MFVIEMYMFGQWCLSIEPSFFFWFCCFKFCYWLLWLCLLVKLTYTLLIQCWFSCSCF